MSKATEAMKKAIQTVDKAEAVLKEAQKEVQKEMQVVETKDRQADRKLKQAAAIKKSSTSKTVAKKPATKAKATPKPRASIRESVKKATDKAVARLTTEAPEVTVKVQVNTSTAPWESANTQVTLSSPKVPETTVVNNYQPAITRPPYVQQGDNVQKNTGTPSKVTNYSGFGTVGVGFSKN